MRTDAPRFLSDDDYLLEWRVTDYAEPHDRLVAYISDFELDPDLRGRGIGAAVYRQWEASLPKTIKYVVIHAVSSVGFWTAMGFKPRYRFSTQPDPDDLWFEESEIMIKGIRGTRTPRPILLHPEDYLGLRRA